MDDCGGRVRAHVHVLVRVRVSVSFFFQEMVYSDYCAHFDRKEYDGQFNFKRAVYNMVLRYLSDKSRTIEESVYIDHIEALSSQVCGAAGMWILPQRLHLIRPCAAPRLTMRCAHCPSGSYSHVAALAPPAPAAINHLDNQSLMVRRCSWFSGCTRRRALKLNGSLGCSICGCPMAISKRASNLTVVCVCVRVCV